MDMDGVGAEEGLADVADLAAATAVLDTAKKRRLRPHAFTSWMTRLLPKACATRSMVERRTSSA
jgi:hypothetical protein